MSLNDLKVLNQTELKKEENIAVVIVIVVLVERKTTGSVEQDRGIRKYNSHISSQSV